MFNGLGQARDPTHDGDFVRGFLTAGKFVSKWNQRDTNGRKMELFPGNWREIANVDGRV